ncbi:unnamed protein product [Schistosoma curassoni]|uniref:Uncharacterized protein n=1 Tax=Schistosoma curassoni TaxID=6186 RepID=A0A3P8DEU3_9TREM|nr:unnamed protein product [Schistosoma curassoni]
MGPTAAPEGLQAEKTKNVAAASAAVDLNIHKGKSKILRYKTTCNNRITLEGEDLEDVKTLTYLDSIIDEHGRSDADRQSTSSIYTTKEYLELQRTVDQHQDQNFQYKCQDSSTVCSGNLEKYESYHLEDTVSAIKCRVCLPCEDKYKKLFQITKDEILDNCGVCIVSQVEITPHYNKIKKTAYSTFQGYQMEGRGCLLKCPPRDVINELTPGLVNKYNCCYYDLCNRTNKLFVQYKLIILISCLLNSLFIIVNRFSVC